MDEYPERSSEILDNSWLTDESIYPVGWTYKQHPNGKGKNGEVKYGTNIRSNTGEIFRSRKAAISFMVEKNYPSEAVEKLRSHFGIKENANTDNEWKEDNDTLPSGWKYKTVANGFRDGVKKYQVSLTSD